MSFWPRVDFEQVLSLEYGSPLKESDRADSGRVPVAGSNGVVGYHSQALVPGPGIVVGRKGSAGKVTWFDEDFWPIDTTYYARLVAPAHMRWAFYLLQHLQLERLSIVTGVPGLNRKDVYRLRVPLPPPSEQRRIVEILDQADALRKLRAAADAKAERILPALFNKMVGDPATNPTGWPVRTVEELAAAAPNSMRTGPFGSSLLHAEFQDSGEVMVLGIDNAVSNRFTWGKARYISRERYQEFDRYRVFPADLLVTIMGTTGRTAVVPSDIPLAMSTKHLAVITLDRNQAEPEYLAAALLYDRGVAQQVRAANIGAIMPGLNLGIIKHLRVRVPDINVQRSFARAAGEIRRIEDLTRDSQQRLDTLLQVLQHRAFSGDLTAKWREAHMQELLAEIEQQAKALAANQQTPAD